MKTRILFIIGFTLICQFILHSQCPTPTLPSGTSTPLIVCENSALTITVEGLAGATYNWQVSAGGTLGTSTTNTNTFSATTAGPYTVNVTQEVTSGSNQCDPSMELVIPIIVDATPTLSAGASTNPSTCSGTNGSIQFTSTNLPNGSHTLNYKKGTSAQSTTITVSSNSFTLLSLTAGSYSDFSVTVNGCTGTFTGPVSLSDPDTPTLSAGASTNPSTCSGTNGSIQFTSTNLPNGSHTLNYKKGTSAQSTTITVSSNSFTLLSLTAGSYSDFSVTVNGCTGTFTGPVSLSDPDTPTLSAGASTNPSTCSGTNGSIQFTSTNLPNGSHTLNYKKGHLRKVPQLLLVVIALHCYH
ncbi:MAG: hypothetical protein IPG00_10840 [Saprospiraceae bacterium]|nr:hypothetical protein [Saprospiraceae bacterium]